MEDRRHLDLNFPEFGDAERMASHFGSEIEPLLAAHAVKAASEAGDSAPRAMGHDHGQEIWVRLSSGDFARFSTCYEMPRNVFNWTKEKLRADAR